MLADILDMLIGIVGTVGYLYIWNYKLATYTPQEDMPTVQQERLKWRRRQWQLLFFIGLLPYVLLLFYMMESSRQFLTPG